MSDKEQVEAVIRVISNRCRNLRKAIDRARGLQTAEAKGQALNDEQRESLRDLARKEALLAELQEILRKQTAVVEPPEPETKMSRRAQKAARAKAREMEEKAKSISEGISEKESEEGEIHEGKDEKNEKETEIEDDAANVESAPNGNGIVNENGDSDMKKPIEQKDKGQMPEKSTQINQANDIKNIAMGAEEREVLLREMADLKLNHEHQLVHCRADAVRRALNLFHVTEFLRQPGSREALLSYYQSPEGKQSPLILTSLHLDLVSYFYVMLTSPNGNVPHPEAVDVSTAHCLGYLQGSGVDAFKGTPYSVLVEIVNTIATCPILTERGVDLNEQKRQGEHDKIKPNSTVRSSAGGLESEPGSVVDNAITDSNP